jgi:hypothetical protein
MKHQKLFKKLKLNKQTVADLEILDLSKLMAGWDPTNPEVTGVFTCRVVVCPTITICPTQPCVCPLTEVTC